MTTSNIEWQRVVKRATTNNNEWQQMTMSGTKNDSEWQRETIKDNKWQWVTPSGKTNENGTKHIEEWMTVIFSLFLGWFLIAEKQYRNIDKGYEEVFIKELRNSRKLRKVKN